MKYFFVTFAIVISVFSSYSQEEKIQGIVPTFDLNYGYGNVKNPVNIPNQSSSHYVSFSLLNATGIDTSSFFNNYKKPLVGATFLYGYLGQKDIMGNVFALYPTWEYSFFNDKSIGWNLRLGTGFGYVTKSYDKVSNPNFMVIGRQLVNATEITPNIWFKFSPHLYAQTGVSLIHFSNGHTAIPNIGLNDYAVRVGVIYKPGTLVGLTVPKRKTIIQDTLWRKTILLGYGRHEFAKTTYPVDGPSYNIYKVGAYISKQINTIHELQFGLSVSFFDSYYSAIKYENYYEHFKPILATQTVFHVGHEFLLNRFGFVSELGVKIFDPYYRSYFIANEIGFAKFSKSVLSSKIGLKFYPIKNSFCANKLAIGMYIKTNFLQADFVEYSMSYTF